MQAFLLQIRMCMKHLWMYTYLGVTEIQNINNMQYITVEHLIFLQQNFLCRLYATDCTKGQAEEPAAFQPCSNTVVQEFMSYARSRLRIFNKVLLLFLFTSLSDLLFEQLQIHYLHSE